MTKVLQAVTGAKDTDTDGVVAVPVARLKTLGVLAGLLVAASSIVTFIMTGQSQLDAVKTRLAESCARSERKDAEHDANLQLIQQQLGQLNGSMEKMDVKMERLLNYNLEQAGRRSR